MAAGKASQDMTEVYMNLPYIVPIRERVERVEARLDRIETALNRILGKLGLGALESIQLEPTPSPSPQPPAPKVEEPQHKEQDPNKLARYEYEPLDPSKSEIRVLALTTTSNKADPIRCSLIRVSLDIDKTGLARDRSQASTALQSFTALSYTWGEPKFDGRIILDGRVLGITKNLEAALQQLRISNKPVMPPHMVALQARNPHIAKAFQAPVTYWWIDAVCINQADLDERNSQVSLMRRIYKRASNVRIWLGEEADDSNMAIDVINQISKPPTRGPGEAPITYPTADEQTKLRTWKALRALFQRPWWERAWIRQEVALASHPTVQCGSETCPMHTFVAACMALAYVCQYLNYDPTADSVALNAEPGWTLPWYETAQTLHNIASDTSNGRDYAPLVQLLFHARASKATDLRDKVFSVLGLADPEVYQIAADYRLSLTDVYFKAARAIITNTKRLDVLSACEAIPLQKYTSYTANFNFDKGERVLSARGYCKGTIRAIHATYVRPCDSNDQLQAIYLSWKQFVEDCGPMFDHLLRRNEYLRKGLLERFNDRAWLDFLSVKTIRSHDLGYTEVSPNDWQLKQPDPDPHLSMATLNIRQVKGLLVPDSVDESTSHAFFRIHCALREFGLGRRLGLSSEGAVLLLPQGAQEGIP
ncbi:hypothetical protein TrVFT333_001047 [Trichoderma virens FT-333]|nr:hypothetical protein TrVFT333_001047 [Trichoderma virens FT-333]